MRVRTRLRQAFWEAVMYVPPRPEEGQLEGSRQGILINRTAKQMNETIRGVMAKRRSYQLTCVREFIGPLPCPIGLLDEDVREGRRIWALPSPFLDPLYKKIIVSSFPVPDHLQQYFVGMWEH